MDKITLTVEPICIPYSNKYLGRLQLHVLQDDVYNLINRGRNILLNAPTGSGKTLTLLSAANYGGAVGVYPNNTLLLNQRDSLGDIITKYSGVGKCIGYYDAEEGVYREPCPTQAPDSPMIVYRVIEDGVLEGYNHIVLFTVSGKTLEKRGETPKREVLYSLTEKAYSFKNSYIVTLTTPDTFLLLYSGAYRDFEGVGKLVHNLLRLIAEGADTKRMEDELRKSGTAVRQTIAPIVGVKARLLEFPLFIDEFHLYGPYELDALYAILKLNKEVSAEEYPVVFSSATPAKDTLETFKDSLGVEYEPVEYTHEGGCGKGFQVRGGTEVEIIGVDSSYKGLGAYYHVGDSVPDILLNNHLDIITATTKRSENVLVVLDRIYQVYQAVDKFVSKGLGPVSCYVSIPHPKCSRGGNVIIGAQRITQGINIDNVRFMASTAVSVEDAIQRFGRSGRRGLDSHVVMFAPKHSVERVLNYDGKTLNYNNFIKEVLGSLYSDISSRQRDATKNFECLHNVRKRMLFSISIISIARVSGQHRVIKKAIAEIDQHMARFVSEKLVFGDAVTYAMFLRFRRTGFRVGYRIANFQNNDSAKPMEEDIGIIIRNAKVVNIRGGLLIIDPRKAPKTVKDRDILVLDASTVKSRLIKGRVVRLNYLRDKYGVEVRVLNSEIRPVSDVLLYVLRSPPKSSSSSPSSQDYAFFLVQSGEAVITDFGSSSTLALFL